MFGGRGRVQEHPASQIIIPFLVIPDHWTSDAADSLSAMMISAAKKGLPLIRRNCFQTLFWGGHGSGPGILPFVVRISR